MNASWRDSCHMTKRDLFLSSPTGCSEFMYWHAIVFATWRTLPWGHQVPVACATRATSEANRSARDAHAFARYISRESRVLASSSSRSQIVSRAGRGAILELYDPSYLLRTHRFSIRVRLCEMSRNTETRRVHSSFIVRPCSFWTKMCL